jgi:hypothetical protein
LLIPKRQDENARPKKAASEKKPALHGRCISGVAGDHPVAQPGTAGDPKKDDNPCGSKGFVAACHRSSKTDKVGVTGFEPATSWSRNGIGDTPKTPDLPVISTILALSTWFAIIALSCIFFPELR